MNVVDDVLEMAAKVQLASVVASALALALASALAVFVPPAA